MLKKFNNNRGSALVMVMLVIIIVPIIIFALFSLSVSENQLVNREYDDQKAYYLARSGAAATANWIEQKSQETVNTTFFKEDNIKATADWQSLEKIPGKIKVEIQKKSNNELLIKSWGKYDDKERIVQLTMSPNQDLDFDFEIPEFHDCSERFVRKINFDIIKENDERVNYCLKEDAEIGNNVKITLKGNAEVNIYAKEDLEFKNNVKIILKDNASLNIYVEEELEIENNFEIKDDAKVNIFAKEELEFSKNFKIRDNANLDIYTKEEDLEFKNNIDIKDNAKVNIYPFKKFGKYKIDYWH